MDLVCQKCGHSFVGDDSEGAFFHQCPRCGGLVEANPTTKVVGGQERAVDDVACPTAGCAGWVCLVEDDDGSSFWGCGQCGNVWDEKPLASDDNRSDA